MLQGYHTVVFLLRQQEYVLAIQALGLLKRALGSAPLLAGEVSQRDAYPRAAIKEQLQVLKNDIVATYHSESTEEIDGLVDKGELVQGLACLILFKLLHQKANANHALSKQAAHGDKALPEQLQNYSLMVVRCYTALKYIEKTFFGEESLLNDRFPFRATLATMLLELAKARAAKKETSVRRLKEVRQLVRGRCKVESIPRVGQQIIMLLIDLSKQFTRGLPTETKLGNFTKAVEMFKQQALEISASEYLIILQLLREI